MNPTQKELIRRHLIRQPISPLEALEKYGCFRLAARIAELREDGLDIETVHTKKNGKHFATYRLWE
jgi:biotin operon repressor